MISEFPYFTPITIDICYEINKFTDEYPPYSDFSSANLFSWNNGDAEITKINGNLAIYYPDYVNGNYILSFIGHNKVADTVKSLLNVTKIKLSGSRLELVPEIAILELINQDYFRVVEDPDSNDYIISLSKLACQDGKGLSHFRRSIKAFCKVNENNVKVTVLDLSSKEVVNSIIFVFKQRELQKIGNDSGNELQAIQRLLNNSVYFKLLCYGIEIDKELRAFIICEDIGKSWSYGHFWKADTNYRGIYSYLMWQTAINLSKLGINFMNIEQDLGIAGLRQFKKSLSPITNLKKYIIRLA